MGDNRRSGGDQQGRIQAMYGMGHMRWHGDDLAETPVTPTQRNRSVRHKAVPYEDRPYVENLPYPPNVNVHTRVQGRWKDEPCSTASPRVFEELRAFQRTPPPVRVGEVQAPEPIVPVEAVVFVHPATHGDT